MIEKNIPQKFVSDKDERLLKVGDMIEAQNITVTQRGEGTESVIKTFKGIETADVSDVDRDWETNFCGIFFSIIL